MDIGVTALTLNAVFFFYVLYLADAKARRERD